MFRNHYNIFSGIVALLAEGVDRNSESVRSDTHESLVALLAEGVDRNPDDFALKGGLVRSPSSRRAWIEIRKIRRTRLLRECRPPRGGRG